MNALELRLKLMDYIKSHDADNPKCGDYIVAIYILEGRWPSRKKWLENQSVMDRWERIRADIVKCIGEIPEPQSDDVILPDSGGILSDNGDTLHILVDRLRELLLDDGILIYSAHYRAFKNYSSAQVSILGGNINIYTSKRADKLSLHEVTDKSLHDTIRIAWDKLRYILTL